MKKPSVQRRVSLGLMVMFLVVLPVTALGVDRKEGIAPFRLRNWNDEEITLQSLRGNNAVVVFTYARCTYGCPMITQYLKDLDKELGSPADLRFVHVSVAPADDTADEVRKHFRKFEIDPVRDPRWLFLTGPAKRIEQLLTSCRIEVSRTALPKGDLIEHTLRVLVLNRVGEVAETFDTYVWDAQRMRNALRGSYVIE